MIRDAAVVHDITDDEVAAGNPGQSLRREPRTMLIGYLKMKCGSDLFTYELEVI